MTTTPDSLSERGLANCRECHQALQPRGEADVLEKFGRFVRLRCTAAECGHEDWFNEMALAQPATVSPPAAEGPGEVWIHDVILGLSFRADGGTDHDDGGSRERQR